MDDFEKLVDMDKEYVAMCDTPEIEWRGKYLYKPPSGGKGETKNGTWCSAPDNSNRLIFCPSASWFLKKFGFARYWHWLELHKDKDDGVPGYKAKLYAAGTLEFETDWCDSPEKALINAFMRSHEGKVWKDKWVKR